MRQKRFKVEEIFRILRECEGGLSGIEVCRKHNISEQTLYRWERKYGGMELSEAKRMKTLEDENSRLKRKIAGLVLSGCVIIKDCHSPGYFEGEATGNLHFRIKHL